jgi:tetratricopeptide (TPR) repeat protein
MTSVLALTLLLAAPAPPPAIDWEKRLDRGLEQARREDKPVMVFFRADWCGLCERLDNSTFVEPQVTARAGNFVMVRVDTEERRAAEALRTYAVGKLPTIVFLSPSGRQVSRVNGFQGPGQFPQTMDHSLEAARWVIAWEDALEKNPDDPRALLALGDHMFAQERYQESHDLLVRAAALDQGRPAPERRRTRTLLAILQHGRHQFAEAELMIKEALSLDPGAPDQPQLLFILGRTYVKSGRRELGVETMQVIVREHPQSPMAEKARETLTVLEQK